MREEEGMRRVSFAFEPSNRKMWMKGQEKGNKRMNEHQKVHESSANTALDNSLDLVVGSIRKVLRRESTWRKKMKGQLEVGRKKEGRAEERRSSPR